MNGSTVHIFEAASLGKGPFKVSHVTTEGGNCEYCSTLIVFRFYIKGQDSKVFFVGSDCVMKTGDAGLIKVVAAEVKKRQKELRLKREAEKLAKLKEIMSDFGNLDKLRALPSPYRWDKNGTLLSYVERHRQYGSKTELLKLHKLVMQALFPKVPEELQSAD